METIRFLSEEEMLCVAGGWDDEDEVEEIIVEGDPFSTPADNNTWVCYPSGNTAYPYNCQVYNPSGGTGSDSYALYPSQTDQSTADRWGRSAANKYT